MYIVKEGDNLLSIARKELGCHTKYVELVRRNQLQSTIIYPGHVLINNKSAFTAMNALL